MNGVSDDHEFAHIDLVSNNTVFRDPRYYEALLQGEDLPVHTFSSFIHEATHHWCFVSPVGMALACLYLSAARRILESASKGDDAPLDDAFDDLATFDIIVRWLRPLSEGLAQFAEYDVLPAQSGTLTSPPLLATLTHLFNLPRRIAGAPEDDFRVAGYELTDDIVRWRLSEQTIKRKSELLLQPIGSEQSAYLLGYLTVKQLWKNSMRMYEELRDADVFMMFLRKIVYGDYALVADILWRKGKPPERALRFGKRLFNNLYAVRMLFSGRIVPWRKWEMILRPPSTEEGATNYNMADGPPFAALDTQKETKKGQRRLVKRLREVTAPIDLASGKNPIPLPWDAFLDLMHERYLMWLGALKAKWVRLGPQLGRIVIGDEVIVDNYKLTEINDGDLNDLTLDMYIDLYGGYQLTTVGNERGVFGFVIRKNVGNEDVTRLKSMRMDRHRIVVITEAISEAIRSYVEDTNYHDQLKTFWEAGSSDVLDRTYLGFAFNASLTAENELKELGVAGILQNNGSLVRNVAAISLAASAEMSPEGLVSMSTELKLDPLGTISKVKELWPFPELPLADVNADGFLASSF